MKFNYLNLVKIVSDSVQFNTSKNFINGKSCFIIIHIHTCQLLRFGRSFSVFKVFKRLKNGPLRFSDFYLFIFYLFIFFLFFFLFFFFFFFPLLYVRKL